MTSLPEIRTPVRLGRLRRTYADLVVALFDDYRKVRSTLRDLHMDLDRLAAFLDSAVISPQRLAKELDRAQ